MGHIRKISISGFKSIKELDGLGLNRLNIVIGANGAGKSNLLQVFQMLQAMEQGRFQEFILKNGGADAFPFHGPKVTPKIAVGLECADDDIPSCFYRVSLTPTAAEEMMLSEERKGTDGKWHSYGSASMESRLKEQKDETLRVGLQRLEGPGKCLYDTISRCRIYHFRDSSMEAPMRRSEIIEDHEELREDASNIAPYLLHLRDSSHFSCHYRDIVNAVRMVMPFFDDFRLDVTKMGEAERVRLSWQQRGSTYPMQPYHLSDGSIRFICLATALLQPFPPSAIIIDEPELGLHPEAIHILTELLESTARETQIIVATQSPLLLDDFSPEDIIVASRDGGVSTFRHLDANDLKVWLEDFTVGDLWLKNIIGGGSCHE